MQLNCAYDPMSRKLVTLLRRAVLILALVLGTVLAVRAYDSQRGEPLEPWHTHVPHELQADELDQAGWADYVAAEAAALKRCAGK